MPRPTTTAMPLPCPSRRGRVRRPPAARPVPASRPLRRDRGACRLPSHAQDGEWRLAEEQSRGEGALSLLTARVDASEGLLYLLDEPETGLSPQWQMALLCLFDDLRRDGCAQALVATHSPILMAHPDADLLWIDGDGITRRPLADVLHWRNMRCFMADPTTALGRLLAWRRPWCP